MESLYTFSYKEYQKLDYNVILNSDPNVSQHNSDNNMLQILWMCRNTLSGRIPITTYNLSWLKLDLIGDNFCPIVTINMTISERKPVMFSPFLNVSTSTDCHDHKCYTKQIQHSIKDYRHNREIFKLFMARTSATVR